MAKKAKKVAKKAKKGGRKKAAKKAPRKMAKKAKRRKPARNADLPIWQQTICLSSDGLPGEPCSYLRVGTRRRSHSAERTLAEIPATPHAGDARPRASPLFSGAS